MRRAMWGTGLAVGLLGVVIGCNPGVRVIRNPGPHAHGIRYYRPKPYLLITPIPSEVTTTTTPGKDKEKEEPKVSVAAKGVSADLVQIKLEYLPDFSEEYAIRVKSGLGTNSTKITLKDGWNLTEINQELDSKFADNVKAVGELISKVAPGGLLSEVAGGGPRAGGQAAFTTPDGASRTQAHPMYARNVPFGYYEPVIGGDHHTGKRLYGWRYVGFAPFVGCPIEPCGAEAATCNTGPLALYGLVMDNGVMMFKPLPEVAATPTAGQLPMDPPNPTPEYQRLAEQMKKENEALRKLIMEKCGK